MKKVLNINTYFKTKNVVGTRAQATDLYNYCLMHYDNHDEHTIAGIKSIERENFEQRKVNS